MIHLMLPSYFDFFLISKDTSSELVLFIDVQTEPTGIQIVAFQIFVEISNSLCYYELG